MSLVLFGFLFFQVEIVILILLRPPLAPSQNICVMRGVMTLPNVLNRAILGPPPRSRSICPPPAQRCVLSPKSPAPLCSAAPPPALVSSLSSATSPPQQHLPSRWSPLPPFSDLPWGNSLDFHSQSQVFLGHKGAEHTAGGAILHYTSLSPGVKSRRPFQKQRQQVVPFYTTSDLLLGPLVPYPFRVTFQAGLKLLASLADQIQPW